MKIRSSKGESNNFSLFKNAEYSIMSVSEKPITTKNGLFYEVQLKIMREDWCRNDWRFENLEKNAKSFAGMPILCAYVKDKITGQYKIGDNHNQEKIENRDGSIQVDTRGADAERIVGKINENEDDIFVKKENGKDWIFAKGVLFAWYHPQLVEQIRKMKTMAISAETLINSDTKIIEEGTNREIYPDWIATGVTILGKDVPPAMPDANIRLMLMSQIKQRLQAIENMGSIDKNGSKKNKEGEKSKVEKEIKLMDFESLFPNSRLLHLSADKDNLVMIRENKFMSYKLDKEMLAKEDFDIKSMSIDESNFTTLESTEKSKKIVRKMSTIVNNEEIEFDIEEEYKCNDCDKKQQAIDSLEQERKEMQEKINSLNANIEQYEKEKNNSKILEAVLKEQSIKEYEGIEEEKKVPKEKMQALIGSIKEGKYNSAEEAIKEYKVLFADTMEAYNSLLKNNSNQNITANSMGRILSSFNSNNQIKDPIAYAKERFGDNN